MSEAMSNGDNGEDAKPHIKTVQELRAEDREARRKEQRKKLREEGDQTIAAQDQILDLITQKAYLEQQRKKQLQQEAEARKQQDIEKQQKAAAAEKERLRIIRELHESKLEAGYQRALTAMQEGPINVIRNVKGIAEHFARMRGDPNYVRADLGVIETNHIHENFFVDVSLDYMPAHAGQSLMVSRKIRIIYNPTAENAKEAFTILISDRNVRDDNREAAAAIKHEEQARRELARTSKEKVKLAHHAYPDSDFVTFKQGSDTVSMFRDILDAAQKAKPTFDYRQEHGRPDYLVDSRQIVWDNDTEEPQLVANGQ